MGSSSASVKVALGFDAVRTGFAEGSEWEDSSVTNLVWPVLHRERLAKLTGGELVRASPMGPSSNKGHPGRHPAHQGMYRLVSTSISSSSSSASRVRRRNPLAGIPTLHGHIGNAQGLGKYSATQGKVIVNVGQHSTHCFSTQPR